LPFCGIPPKEYPRTVQASALRLDFFKTVTMASEIRRAIGN